MNNVLISILLVLIGLIVGFAVSFLINMLRDNLLSKKTERMLAQTKKEIDKRCCFRAKRRSSQNKDGFR